MFNFKSKPNRLKYSSQDEWMNEWMRLYLGRIDLLKILDDVNNTVGDLRLVEKWSTNLIGEKTAFQSTERRGGLRRKLNIYAQILKQSVPCCGCHRWKIEQRNWVVVMMMSMLLVSIRASAEATRLLDGSLRPISDGLYNRPASLQIFTTNL